MVKVMGSSPVESTLRSMKIDKIYVLAINHTQEKINDIISRLEAAEFEPGTNYTIITGHNAYEDEIPEGVKVYDKWGNPNHWNKFWQMPVQIGEVGCTLSHIKGWNAIAAEDGVERGLILEEDFNPVAGKAIKDLPEPDENWPFVWDYMSLGRWSFNEKNDVKLNDTYCIPGLHYNMHAYVLTKVGAQKLVDYHLEKNLFINDEFITATYMKHRREYVEALYPVKTISAIATNEDWFNQLAHESMVSAHTRD